MNPKNKKRLELLISILLKFNAEMNKRLDDLQKVDIETEQKRITKTYKILVTSDDLNKFIKKHGRDMRNLLMSYWAAEQNAVDRKLLSNLFGFGMVGTEYQKTFDYNTDYFNNGFITNFSNAVQDQLRKIAAIISAWLQKPYITNAAAQRLLNYINDEGLGLAVSLANQRQRILQDMLLYFLRNDISLGQAVSLMQQSIVLTPKMAEKIRKIYTAALNAGKTKAEALQLARAASERLKNWRARTIIRTELNRAKHIGDYEALKQGIERGLLENVYKTWRRTAYNDNWQSSIDNDGITVPLDGLFSNGAQFPDEINERCILEYMMIRGGI